MSKVKKWIIWTQKKPGEHTTNAKQLAPGELPICCPEQQKDPTPKPVDRFDSRYPAGTRVCKPCGSEWTPDSAD